MTYTYNSIHEALRRYPLFVSSELTAVCRGKKHLSDLTPDVRQCLRDIGLLVDGQIPTAVRSILAP